MKNLFALFLLLAAFSGTCLGGKIYQNLAELPAPKKVYDFVVIGGGTVGLVVAHRLAEDKWNSVLVIEAGGTNTDDLNLQVPAYYGQVLGTNADWKYVSTPQSGIDNRNVAYPLGHVLGGSSSISGGAYTRGSSEMYDMIAQVTGDDGWSWNSLTPYILRDGHDTSEQIDSSVHGQSGIFKVKAASEELGHEFTYIQDMNDGQELGVGYQLFTIRSGMHENSATAYLPSSFVKEHNIDVVLNTLATRIVPDAPYPGLQGLNFRTVEVSGSRPNVTGTVPPGPRIMFTADKEIIISAGAIRTPQILMLSGIGPKSHLDSMGIPTIYRSFYTNESFPTDSDRAQWLKQWNETRTGPLTIMNTNMRGLFRMSETELEEFKQNFNLSDPASGKKSSHYELVFLHNISPHRATFGIMISDMNPKSRGQVRLNSTDPYALPLINPNLLGEESDLRFLNATTFKGYLLEPIGNVTLPDSGDNSRIDELARMGDKEGVVDPNLKLKGATGVRIVDASPFVPGTQTQTPVYIIAERAADLIKKEGRSKTLILPTFR
ncbi:alcohol oxidase [Marasmius fiardii PR-910]|nr:alcohol oxidase [Marasmius fiardii PR-910]